MPVEFGDIAQGLAGEEGGVQIMFFDQEPVKLGPLVIEEAADVDALQEIGFVDNRCGNHRRSFSKGRARVRSFVIPQPPCFQPLHADESALVLSGA